MFQGKANVAPFRYLSEAKLFGTDSPRLSEIAESNPGSWTDRTSGRERVRHVVELLDQPTPVQEIADRADVSRATADDELERLQSDDWATETTVDGAKAYDLNPVRLLFDEVTDLIDANSREELKGEPYEYYWLNGSSGSSPESPPSLPRLPSAPHDD